MRRRNKFSWRDLIGEPPLCEGGRLVSIVFCCDPRRVKCPILEKAFEMLDLTAEEFVRVMERHGKPVVEVDGTCYGNLAFCPSPEKESKDRDKTLLKMGWNLTRYLKYKFEILCNLLPPDKLKLAFRERVMKQYAIELLDLETKRVYRALALGNIEAGMFIVTEVFNEKDLINNKVETILSSTEYVGVRIPSHLIKQLDDLVEKGIIKSRSDGIRRALQLYLTALKNVKQETVVKR